MADKQTASVVVVCIVILVVIIFLLTWKTPAFSSKKQALSVEYSKRVDEILTEQERNMRALKQQEQQAQNEQDMHQLEQV